VDPLPLGAPLWLAYYDLETGRFIPRCVGTIEGRRGDLYLVSGEWRTVGFPRWTDEAEAREYCATHPEVPDIK
jgi:hypothetical protein